MLQVRRPFRVVSVPFACREFHNGDLRKLCSSPNVNRMIELRRRLGTWHAWERSAYTLPVGEPEGKRLLGNRRCKWKDFYEGHLAVLSVSGVGW